MKLDPNAVKLTDAEWEVISAIVDESGSPHVAYREIFRAAKIAGIASVVAALGGEVRIPLAAAQSSPPSAALEYFEDLDRNEVVFRVPR